jgi:hypothetical protein
MTVTSSSGDIPAGTIVTALSGTTATISQAATGSNTNEILTFTPLYPASVIIQLGSWASGSFLSVNPNTLDVLRLGIDLARSNAI